MRRVNLALAGLAAIFVTAAGAALGAGAGSEATNASPIYGVTIPDGYRRWELVAPALEADPLNELRAVVGNSVAIEAYRAGTLPFPDGAVLVKLAWKRAQSPEFEPASVPGAATTVQVMVKDSKKYAATGGWGFAGSSTANRSMRLSTRPASLAMRRAFGGTTMSSRGSRRNPAPIHGFPQEPGACGHCREIRSSHRLAGPAGRVNQP